MRPIRQNDDEIAFHALSMRFSPTRLFVNNAFPQPVRIGNPWIRHFPIIREPCCYFVARRSDDIISPTKRPKESRCMNGSCDNEAPSGGASTYDDSFTVYANVTAVDRIRHTALLRLPNSLQAADRARVRCPSRGIDTPCPSESQLGCCDRSRTDQHARWVHPMHGRCDGRDRSSEGVARGISGLA